MRKLLILGALLATILSSDAVAGCGKHRATLRERLAARQHHGCGQHGSGQHGCGQYGCR